jgi:hypothetical protein
MGLYFVLYLIEDISQQLTDNYTIHIFGIEHRAAISSSSLALFGGTIHLIYVNQDNCLVHLQRSPNPDDDFDFERPKRQSYQGLGVR